MCLCGGLQTSVLPKNLKFKVRGRVWEVKGTVGESSSVQHSQCQKLFKLLCVRCLGVFVCSRARVSATTARRGVRLAENLIEAKMTFLFIY